MIKRIIRAFTLTLLSLMVLIPAQAMAEGRYALVIGNGAYKKLPLKQAVNNALAVKNSLEQQGFTVLYRENLQAKDIPETLLAFSRQIKRGSQALFYYSGHALQLNGVNYLSAVDAWVKAAEDVAAVSLNLNEVLDAMNAAKPKMSLLFIDASRKTYLPRRVHRGVQGLAKVTAPANTLISFANSPVHVALNPRLHQRLYTDEILKAINNDSVPLKQSMQLMGEQVIATSKHKMKPWLSVNLEAGTTFAGKIISTGIVANTIPPQPAKHSAGDTVNEPVLGMHMTYIAPGSFMMGSDEEEEIRYRDEELHQVQIKKGFWAGTHEVTFDQYDAFCKATDNLIPADEGWGRGARPVMNITWLEATSFANWMSGKTGRHYRLPTEAEWEYMARAGTTTAFSFGDHQSDFVQYAWNGESANKQTHPVGEKKPNPWGLFDVHGNVWEWTSSKYAEDYDGTELLDSSLNASQEKRSVRGGSWYFFPKSMRSADRRLYHPLFRRTYIGFRLVRDE